MTAREIYDLALRGGGNDFQATVELLERLGEPWCLIRMSKKGTPQEREFYVR